MLNFRVTARFKYPDGRSDAEWQMQQPHSIEEIKFLIEHVLTSERAPSSLVVTIVPYQLDQIPASAANAPGSSLGFWPDPCDEALWLAAMRAHPHYKEVKPGDFEWIGEGREPTTHAMIQWFQMSHSTEARRIEAEIKEDATARQHSTQAQ
jgi:hypothetical protein